MDAPGDLELWRDHEEGMTMRIEHKDALLSELQIQRSLADSYRRLVFMVPPSAIAVTAGVAAFASPGKEYVGLIMQFLVIFLMCWLAFLQMNLAFSGIRCVELELRINRLLGVPNKEGLNWSLHALNRAHRVPGFKVYLATAAMLAVVLFVVGTAKATEWMMPRAGPGLTLAAQAAIVFFAVLVSVSMFRTHAHFSREKAMLMADPHLNPLQEDEA